MRRHSKRGDGHTIEILAGIRLFGACSRHELARLAGLFRDARHPAGTVLVREGEPGTEFSIIVDGTATAMVGERYIATLGRGEFFGEMSLLEHAPRAATIAADTGVELLVADAGSFTALVDSAPSVGMRMMRMMSERLRSVEAPVGSR